MLHSMIVEDEKELVRIPLDLSEIMSTTIVLPSEVSTNTNPNPSFVEVLNRNSAIRARSTHRQLKDDLVERILHYCYGQRNNYSNMCNQIATFHINIYIIYMLILWVMWII